MRIERYLPFISFVGFSVVILLFLAMSQKPLCIDSRVVERMDRVSQGQTETIFRCQIQKRVPYSQFWSESQVPQRLSDVENLLQGIEPFRRKYQITLVKEKPLLYQVKGTQVKVGENLLVTPGQAERLLVSLWVYEKAQIDLEKPNLALEILVDFLMGVLQKKMTHPLSLLPISSQQSTWPTILRSQKGYCESSWSVPHHFNFCAEMLASQFDPQSKNIVLLSLRPFVLEKLQESFAQLNLKQKNSIYKNMAKMIRALNWVDFQRLPVEQSSDLLRAKNLIEKVGHQLFAAGQQLAIAELKTWGSLYRLKTVGDLQESSKAHARVDTIFDFSTLSENAVKVRVNQLLEDKRWNQNKKIAVIGTSKIYFLPDTAGVAVDQFGQLNSKYRVIESCLDLELNHLWELEKFAENILLVQDCAQGPGPRYSAFLRGGVKDFVMTNSGVSYVDLHGPSFLSRKESLLELTTIFKGLQQNQAQFAEAYHWSRVDVDESTRSFVPDAAIEGLRSYRLPPPH